MLLLTTFGILGCGHQDEIPGLVRVSGTVKLADTPVEGATVTFQPDGQARSASGLTDKNGLYKLTTLNPGDGALPGSYKVTISKVEDTDPAHHVSAEDFAKGVASGKGPPAPPRNSKKKNEGLKYHVPEKYMTADKSKLTAQVDDQNRKFDFNLEK